MAGTIRAALFVLPPCTAAAHRDLATSAGTGADSWKPGAVAPHTIRPPSTASSLPFPFVPMLPLTCGAIAAGEGLDRRGSTGGGSELAIPGTRF